MLDAHSHYFQILYIEKLAQTCPGCTFFWSSTANRRVNPKKLHAAKNLENQRKTLHFIHKLLEFCGYRFKLIFTKTKKEYTCVHGGTEVKIPGRLGATGWRYILIV